MLEKLNAEAYLTRPAQFGDAPVESGIWFYPGEDPHSLMKAIKTPSGLEVRSSSGSLLSTMIWLGSSTPPQDRPETVIEVTVEVPGESIDGTLLLTAQALATDATDEDDPRMVPYLTILDKEQVKTIEEFREAFERINPAVLGLTI